VVICLALLGGSLHEAQACSCIGEEPDYHAVFLGTVVSQQGYIPPYRWMRWALWTILRLHFEDVHYQVRVQTSWFGVTNPDVTVATWVDSSCSASIEIGKSYIFRTMRLGEVYERIGACQYRPTLVDLASFDEETVLTGADGIRWSPAAIQKGTTIIHWPPLPPKPFNPWRWVGPASLASLLTLIYLAVFLRRRMRQG
jgi:hypothetical protein